MPVTGLKQEIKAYTIEASGTPVATVKAASVLDVMKFVLDDFDDLTGNGYWDGEQPLAIRNANRLEADALATHFVYWHSRESMSREDAVFPRAVRETSAGIQPAVPFRLRLRWKLPVWALRHHAAVKRRSNLVTVAIPAAPLEN
jgi:hypothetical protein